VRQNRHNPRDFHGFLARRIKILTGDKHDSGSDPFISCRLFLVGAVLAWSFRVWILLPISFLAMAAPFILELSLGESLSTAFGSGLLLVLTPRVGYAFGLFARSILMMARSAPGPRSPREISSAALYSHRSVKRSRQNSINQPQEFRAGRSQRQPEGGPANPGGRFALCIQYAIVAHSQTLRG